MVQDAKAAPSVVTDSAPDRASDVAADGAGQRPSADPSLGARIGWRPPNGRDLLAGVAVLAVCFAVLIVFTSDAAPQRRPGDAQPLPLADAAAADRTAPVPWESVPVATRVTELGPSLARPVAEGLAAARGKLARCVAVDRRRQEATPAPAPAEPAPAELLLSLAARAGAVHVEAVDVRSPGTSPELAGCARRLLAGAAFPAPDAVAGRRYRLVHVVD